LTRGAVLHPSGEYAMTILCDAVYENGVLRPLKPPGLREGEQVEVLLVTRGEAATSGAEAESAAAILARIAALPLPAEDRGFSGSDHDQVLYGEPDR
jgi:predicted DNA-binding antitoxin AbrB/MazE fold protein